MPSTFQIRTAQRSKSKLRLGFSGPSGSGKTYSALLLARGLAPWEKIGIVDTENGSADLYSELGPYNVITLEKPFDPKRYIEAIKAFEEAGMEVIIVDSITHEWSGEGGLLDMQTKIGGRFQDWAKVTPLHNRFIQTLLQSHAHIITTVRSKTDYAMENDGKSTKVQKVGTKPETREGFEYELTASFDLNINNLAEASKDRTGLFKGEAPFTVTEETGKMLAEWASSGIDYVKQISELAPKKGKTVETIVEAYKVESLDDLTYSQKKAVLNRLESMPDAPKEEEKPKEEPKQPSEPKAPEKPVEKEAEPVTDPTDEGPVENHSPEDEKSEGEKIADEVEEGLAKQEAEKALGIEPKEEGKK